MAHTVKAVAEMAGISIRTLHHYDQISLLKPAALSEAGYRLYSKQDLERLQQILFFRELGFGLEEIRTIIDSPAFDRRQALLGHKGLLLERQERLARLIQTVDRTLERMEREMTMSEKEMKELFDGFDQSKYEEEARQRWGQSKAYQQSVERTKKYTRSDWTVIKEEMQQISLGMANLMDRGPEDPEVQAWIGRWHQLINDRFYTCSLEIFRSLGDMYVQDERFTASYDQVKPGLAAFMRAAMHVYCDKGEGE